VPPGTAEIPFRTRKPADSVVNWFPERCRPRHSARAVVGKNRQQCSEQRIAAGLRGQLAGDF
jgi:hypothetical protein